MASTLQRVAAAATLTLVLGAFGCSSDSNSGGTGGSPGATGGSGGGGGTSAGGGGGSAAGGHAGGGGTSATGGNGGSAAGGHAGGGAGGTSAGGNGGSAAGGHAGGGGAAGASAGGNGGSAAGGSGGAASICTVTDSGGTDVLTAKDFCMIFLASCSNVSGFTLPTGYMNMGQCMSSFDASQQQHCQSYHLCWGVEGITNTTAPSGDPMTHCPHAAQIGLCM